MNPAVIVLDLRSIAFLSAALLCFGVAIALLAFGHIAPRRAGRTLRAMMGGIRRGR